MSLGSLQLDLASSHELTQVWVTPAAFWAQTGAMIAGHFPLQAGVMASDLERMAKVEAIVKVIKAENFIFGSVVVVREGRGVWWKLEELLMRLKRMKRDAPGGIYTTFCFS